MTAPPIPSEAPLQRSCALCGAVDDGPRNIITVDPAGTTVFTHLPGSEDCAVPGADPHPELDESAAQSQLRYALEVVPTAETPSPDQPLVLHSIDASNPDAEPTVEGA